MSGERTILVSGGAGYIGSHTALALKQNGFTPVVVDSLISGHAWATKFGPFRQGDIGDEDFIRAVCEEFRPAALIHFAAFIDVAESVREPAKYFENNTQKAGRLFDTVLAAGVRHVVFSSTAAVYGAVGGDKPLAENLPLKPINPYGQSKLQAEEYLRSLGSKGMTSVALRYFNASGDASPEHGIGEAHWPETHLVPNAVLAAIMPGRKLSVFGTDYPTKDGTAVRDYVHVEDLADAHVRALSYLENGGSSEICNLGTGRGNSVREVIAAVENFLGNPVNKEFGPRRAGDPATLVADFGKANTLLGWCPRRTLDEIVKSAVDWHKSSQYLDFLKSRIG